MTWTEIEALGSKIDLPENKEKMTFEQITWVIIASELDSLTAMLLLNSLNIDELMGEKEINTISIARKLSETFDFDLINTPLIAMSLTGINS